jgi:hypothetical protein
VYCLPSSSLLFTLLQCTFYLCSVYLFSSFECTVHLRLVTVYLLPAFAFAQCTIYSSSSSRCTPVTATVPAPAEVVIQPPATAAATAVAAVATTASTAARSYEIRTSIQIVFAKRKTADIFQCDGNDSQGLSCVMCPHSSRLSSLPVPPAPSPIPSCSTPSCSAPSSSLPSSSPPSSSPLLSVPPLPTTPAVYICATTRRQQERLDSLCSLQESQP